MKQQILTPGLTSGIQGFMIIFHVLTCSGNASCLSFFNFFIFRSPGLAQEGWPVYGKEGTYLLMDGNFTTAEYLYKDRLYIWIKKIPSLLNPQPTSSGLRLSSVIGVLVSLMVMILL